MYDELIFPDRESFREWLTENHDKSGGTWLVFGKNDSLKTLKPDEALEEALCFGWIDGQIKSIDETRYLKKFTPRGKGSKWSARNREIAAALIKSGRMAGPGIKAIEIAKKHGSWDIPRAEPVTDSQVEILTAALQGHEPALTNFLKMPASVRRTYTAAYLDAKKEETRIKRLQTIIQRLNENKKPM